MGARVITPTLRHVATCIPCGWRKVTRLTNSYPTVCDNLCPGRLEHAVIAFDDRQELAEVHRDGQIRRGRGRRGAK